MNCEVESIFKMEISIDTSTKISGIALSESGRVIIELNWHCEQNHTVELMSNIKLLLERTQKDVKQVKAIFVALGPGSYNGLRAGVTTAKGLAYSLSVPIIGVSTLYLEAYPFFYPDISICAIQNAGRNEFAAAIYCIENNDVHTILPESILTIKEIAEEIKKKTIVVGELQQEVKTELKKLSEGNIIITQMENSGRRAAFLAESGWKKLLLNSVDDVQTIQPIYLRRPHITSPKDGRWQPQVMK